MPLRNRRNGTVNTDGAQQCRTNSDDAVLRIKRNIIQLVETRGKSHDTPLSHADHRSLVQLLIRLNRDWRDSRILEVLRDVVRRAAFKLDIVGRTRRIVRNYGRHRNTSHTTRVLQYWLGMSPTRIDGASSLPCRTGLHAMHCGGTNNIFTSGHVGGIVQSDGIARIRSTSDDPAGAVTLSPRPHRLWHVLSWFRK